MLALDEALQCKCDSERPFNPMLAKKSCYISEIAPHRLVELRKLKATLTLCFGDCVPDVSMDEPVITKEQPLQPLGPHVHCVNLMAILGDPEHWARILVKHGPWVADMVALGERLPLVVEMFTRKDGNPESLSKHEAAAFCNLCVFGSGEFAKLGHPHGFVDKPAPKRPRINRQVP